MDKIEIRVLNPDAIPTGERMMVFGARLTQRGHSIKNMDDLVQLYHKSYSLKTLKTMLDLPHANIKRFSQITVAVVGASRRFLAQITRHQDDCHFISASLQYSNYTGEANFCIPYSILVHENMEEQHLGTAAFDLRAYYLQAQNEALAKYEEAIRMGMDHDEAAYLMPHGLRNILLITATPFQWMHMISQRTCRRNSIETQYVMLRIWEELAYYSPMFELTAAPDCAQVQGCREGKMSCKHTLINDEVRKYQRQHDALLPTAALAVWFPLLP